MPRLKAEKMCSCNEKSCHLLMRMLKMYWIEIHLTRMTFINSAIGWKGFKCQHNKKSTLKNLISRIPLRANTILIPQTCNSMPCEFVDMSPREKTKIYLFIDVFYRRIYLKFPLQGVSIQMTFWKLHSTKKEILSRESFENNWI